MSQSVCTYAYIPLSQSYLEKKNNTEEEEQEEEEEIKIYKEEQEEEDEKNEVGKKLFVGVVKPFFIQKLQFLREYFIETNTKDDGKVHVYTERWGSISASSKRGNNKKNCWYLMDQINGNGWENLFNKKLNYNIKEHVIESIKLIFAAMKDFAATNKDM